jgi:hypothetical protein
VPRFAFGRTPSHLRTPCSAWHSARTAAGWLPPACTGKDAPNVNISGGRPDLVKSSVAMPKTLGAWFDKTAFAIPGNGLWGNAGRGIIQGPGYAIFNLG